jgi:hypothetical protein
MRQLTKSQWFDAGMDFYVFKVWAVANLFYSLVLFAMFMSLPGSHYHSLEDWLRLLKLSFICSLPSLLLIWVLIRCMEFSEMSIVKRYIVCLFLVSLVPAGNFIFLFFGFPAVVNKMELLYPAMITAPLALLLFRKSFFRLFKSELAHG